MVNLNDLTRKIFQVEGIRVALSGNSTVNDYWKTKFTADGTVAQYKARFAKRYPGIDIAIYTGIGLPAHGNYLFKNLRATYEFSWIKKEHEDLDNLWYGIFSDLSRKIKALKKSLRESSRRVTEEEEVFDPYDVLDVKPDASDEEIKHAYNLHVQAFHPDKFVMMKPLAIKFANEKTQEINRARDEIARRRAS